MIGLRQLLVCAIVLILTENSLATSVLVVETEDNVIFLAADALQTETLTGRTSRICKIIRLSGSTYWAAASNFYKTSAGFDVEEIVASIGTQGTVDAKMQRFVAAVKAPLTQQVALLKTVDPEEYGRYLAGTHTPLEIVFVGIENGKPKWAVTRFFVKKRGNSVIIDPRPEKRESPPSATGLGFWGPAAAYVVDHSQQLYSDPLRTIKKSLDTAADSDPYKGVGAPYSVLRIAANGHTWMQQGECRPD